MTAWWRSTSTPACKPASKNSRNITFQYVQGTASAATIGIQKSPLGPAVQWSFNAASTFTNLQLTFIPS